MAQAFLFKGSGLAQALELYLFRACSSSNQSSPNVILLFWLSEGSSILFCCLIKVSEEFFGNGKLRSVLWRRRDLQLYKKLDTLFSC